MDSRNKNGNDNKKVDPLFAGKPPKKHSIFDSWQFQAGIAIVVTLATAYAFFIAHIPISTIAAGLASLFGGLILINIFMGIFMD